MVPTITLMSKIRISDGFPFTSSTDFTICGTISAQLHCDFQVTFVFADQEPVGYSAFIIAQRPRPHHKRRGNFAKSLIEKRLHHRAQGDASENRNRHGNINRSRFSRTGLKIPIRFSDAPKGPDKYSTEIRCGRSSLTKDVNCSLKHFIADDQIGADHIGVTRQNARAFAPGKKFGIAANIGHKLEQLFGPEQRAARVFLDAGA